MSQLIVSPRELQAIPGQKIPLNSKKGSRALGNCTYKSMENCIRSIIYQASNCQLHSKPLPNVNKSTITSDGVVEMVYASEIIEEGTDYTYSNDVRNVIRNIAEVLESWNDVRDQFERWKNIDSREYEFHPLIIHKIRNSDSFEEVGELIDSNISVIREHNKQVREHNRQVTKELPGIFRSGIKNIFG